MQHIQTMTRIRENWRMLIPMATERPFSFLFPLVGMLQIFRLLRIPRNTEQRIMNSENNSHSHNWHAWSSHSHTASQLHVSANTGKEGQWFLSCHIDNS